jgi:hypothetical protein
MTGIREAYADYKARKKSSRGMFIIIANDQALLDEAKMNYPGANIYVPVSDDGDLELVWEGR